MTFLFYSIFYVFLRMAIQICIRFKIVYGKNLEQKYCVWGAVKKTTAFTGL